MSLFIKIDSDFSYDKSLIDNLTIEDKTEISIDYISDFRSAKILRDIVSKILKKIWVDLIWEKRLILVVDELNNNAIEYWTKANDYNNLYICIEKNNKKINIKIEVSDKWNWKLPKKAKEMEELRRYKKQLWFENHNSIRWRWLFLIIEKLVNKLYFKDSKDWWLTVGIIKEL